MPEMNRPEISRERSQSAPSKSFINQEKAAWTRYRSMSQPAPDRQKAPENPGPAAREKAKSVAEPAEYMNARQQESAVIQSQKREMDRMSESGEAFIAPNRYAQRRTPDNPEPAAREQQQSVAEPAALEQQQSVAEPAALEQHQSVADKGIDPIPHRLVAQTFVTKRV